MIENISPFIQTQKEKQLLMRRTLKMYLSQSMLQLYEISEYILEKIRVG